MAGGEFQFPVFYDYPPYFTLQPVKETQDKQCAHWGALILGYCRHHKVFRLDVDGSDDTPLFTNSRINRRLSREGRKIFLEALVQRGNAEWLDKEGRKCLILWKTKSQWADTIYEFVQSYGLQGSVMTVEEISIGDDTHGTDLEGLDREVVLRAVGILQDRGKARSVVWHAHALIISSVF